MSTPVVYRTQTIIVPSAARTTSGNSDDFTELSEIGSIFYLNITAASGTTPTLDLRLQARIAAGVYIDVPGASFSQKTTTGLDSLAIHPALTPVANRAVSQVLPTTYRWVWTIAGTTPSFTFTIVEDSAE